MLEPGSCWRYLDIITPQINFRSFIKHQPSPLLSRKTNETPILPSFGITKSTVFKSGIDTTDECQHLPSSINIEIKTSERIGYVEDSDRPEEKATPVRKITTKFEKDLDNSVGNIAVDLEQINERIAEVERLDAYIEEKMRNVEPESDDERRLIEQHLKLLNEKDSLVRRLDYLNVLIDLKETTAKVETLQKLLNDVTTDELLHTNKTETLMLQLKELIDKKDELSHTLMNKEAEEEEESERNKRLVHHWCRNREEEESERGKLLVQQSQYFMRGTVEPLSASKRIFTWFSPKTSN